MTLIFYKGKPKLSYKVSYNEVDLKKRLKGESVTMITAVKQIVKDVDAGH